LCRIVGFHSAWSRSSFRNLGWEIGDGEKAGVLSGLLLDPRHHGSTLPQSIGIGIVRTQNEERGEKIVERQNQGSFCLSSFTHFFLLFSFPPFNFKEERKSSSPKVFFDHFVKSKRTFQTFSLDHIFSYCPLFHYGSIVI